MIFSIFTATVDYSVPKDILLKSLNEQGLKGDLPLEVNLTFNIISEEAK